MILESFTGMKEPLEILPKEIKQYSLISLISVKYLQILFTGTPKCSKNRYDCNSISIETYSISLVTDAATKAV